MLQPCINYSQNDLTKTKKKAFHRENHERGEKKIGNSEIHVGEAKSTHNQIGATSKHAKKIGTLRKV